MSKSVIPNKLRSELSKDPFYKVCALSVFPDHVCRGEITWEHAIIYGGKAVQKRWAIIPICEGGHNVGKYLDDHSMVKEIHQWIALYRARPEDIKEMTGERGIGFSPFLKCSAYFKLFDVLVKKYGPFHEQEAIMKYKPPVYESRVTPSRIEGLSAYLGPAAKKKLFDCMHYWMDHEVFYTPNQMLEKMIDTCHEVIKDKINNKNS